MAAELLPQAWSARVPRTSSAAGAPGAEPPEEQLAHLAAAVGPLRRAMAAIAARFTAIRASERLGYARLGDYARERPGVSARQLQELARVHRALAALPALERALVNNALPWSKVRLVARFAAGEDECDWIARASALTVRALEREARARAGGAPSGDEDEEPRTRVAVRCTPAAHASWSAACELAERVAGERLTRAEVLEFVSAEVLSAAASVPALADGAGAPHRTPPEDTASAALAARRAPGRALPHAVASLSDGLEEADAFDLDRRLRRAVRLEQTLDAAMAPLLRVVRSPEYEWRTHWRPLAAYAEEELGMSARKARALVRLERAGDVCPELRAAYRSGRLSWVKAQCLLPLLLLDFEGERGWRAAWVAWASRVTLRRLAADVERGLLLRTAHPRAWRRCEAHPERVRDALGPEERQTCAHEVDPDATEQIAWRVPRSVGPLVAAALLAAGSFEAMLDHALESWRLREPGARRPDPVFERDGWRCAVPGCTSRRNLHDHHVVFRSAGGSDAPGNRVALCAFHHLRGVHAGRVRVLGRAPDGLVFELGVRAGAAPLVRYGSGDVLMG